MEDEEESPTHPSKSSGSGSKVLGIILIVLAALIGVRTLTPWIPGEWIIIAIFLGLGLFFLVKRN
jgi:hypothetical protein